ncbi:MAG TPA: class I adenylate-forming enzyme family protein, partial [bacterium]|nr:class I adenylate-forming enzyme family protein [bacterium]
MGRSWWATTSWSCTCDAPSEPMQRAPIMASANLASVLERRAEAGGWPDRVAFTSGDRSFTHGEVHEGGARLASWLAEMGVERGDRVLIALSDRVELAWAFLAAVRLAAIAIPVNPELTPEDHRQLASDSAARAVVCEDGLAAPFKGHGVVLHASDLAPA